MTFEEHLAELAKGQRELQQADLRLTNALNHLVEVQAGYEPILNRLMQVQTKNESLMTQVLEALARLANTAAAHEARIERLEER